ncbi:MAG: hypothetical protein QF752_11145 [Planctomycetota bacterium]|jgi:hypothetical protein|nr:hypothetical protein [Planctomycetota bacterium]
MSEQIRVHKIASATSRLQLEAELQIDPNISPENGQVVVGEALREKRIYAELELVSGRMAKILKGDRIVGVLGSRAALRGFVGTVPSQLFFGDTLHVLNKGGVIGRCTSSNQDLGDALPLRYLGTVVGPDGGARNIGENAIAESQSLESTVPIILVAGSCMNSGKTQAACEIVAGLTSFGVRVAAGKVSGVACLRDVLNMQDHGAIDALSFIDCGHPSTAGIESVVPLTKGILNVLSASSPDVIVLEIGDGIVGGYGCESLFQDDELMRQCAFLVFCANDLLAAWGGVRFLEQIGRTIDCISGPATDNEVGTQWVEQSLGLRAVNARTQPGDLARLSGKAFRSWSPVKRR